MYSYLDIVKRVIDNGVWQTNARTGERTKILTGERWQHDMQTGFPLLTSKFVPLRVVAVELEFFIKGLSDKKWLQERECHIWDEWANPLAIENSTYVKSIRQNSLTLSNNERRKLMANESDLGPIYGVQWRAWPTPVVSDVYGYDIQSIDQLTNVLHALKTDPTSRRMVVSAWNPSELDSMALLPCHFAWQTTVVDGVLNLTWYQRSTDVMLGLPFNIASYALLLKLLAAYSGFKEGLLTCFSTDTHIYESHIEQAEVQLARAQYALPTVDILGTDVADWSPLIWTASDVQLNNYQHAGRLSMDVVV